MTRSGIDLTHIDAGTRPQDDLFVHVNGKWLDEYEIPADRAVDGAFRTLYDKAEEDVKTLIQEASESGAAHGTDAQKIGDLYSSFMDADAVEAAGLSPIAEELAAVANAADLSELAGIVGRLQRTGVGGGIGQYVDTDAKDSSRYLVHFTQSVSDCPTSRTTARTTTPRSATRTSSTSGRCSNWPESSTTRSACSTSRRRSRAATGTSSSVVTRNSATTW